MAELDINRHQFPIGSVVYFLRAKPHWNTQKDLYYVSFGIVEENYVGTVVVQLYELVDMCLINGIPKKEFETPTQWHKLPKGWSYDTKLFDISYADYSVNPKDYKFDNPNDILRAIEDGLLVKVSDNDHANIESEIDKKNGWRVVRRYTRDECFPQTYTSIDFHHVYKTYREAKQELNDIETEWKRQSELSDYDWSVEQIDNALNRWAHIYTIPDDTKQKYRNWLLEQDNVEDLEIRVFGGEIQWKYWKNRRWKNIEI